jgi:tRNA dimethylallyltransferase
MKELATGNHLVIAVMGPTGVGKTALAISVAKALDTAILSADSRQCYREITIGTAKPSADQLAAVEHGFVNTHSIHQPVSAGDFEHEGLDYLDQVFRSRPYAVVVGGSGLYLKALLEGMDPVPRPDPAIRAELQQALARDGLKALTRKLAEADPEGYQAIDQQNPARVLRALEVIRTTGCSITAYWRRKPLERPFRVLKLGLTLPRPHLHDRIHERCDRMLQDGLLEEARGLLSCSHYQVLQTVGYQEFFRYLAGNKSYDTAVEEFKAHTRQFAKRQLTWFRRDPDLHWLSPDSHQEALQLITQAASFSELSRARQPLAK